MIKVLLVFALAASGDPWWGKDKCRHFATAYILTRSVHQAGVKKHYSAGIVLGLSISKEVYDKKIKKSIFSFKDLVYDIAGVTLGLLL
jgi:uncharacterized protein YfiM (DUF2279 family)